MAPAHLCSHVYCNLSLADETPRCAPAIPSSASVFTGPASLNFSYTNIHKMHFSIACVNNRDDFYLALKSQCVAVAVRGDQVG